MKRFLLVLLALILTLSLVACVVDGEDTDDGDDTDPQQEGETNSEGDEGGGYQFDIKEDDHTVIIAIRATYQVYTHDGVNVTGYTTYADCGDAATARAMASTINPNDPYFEGMGLKSVTVKGSYLIQDYSEEGFPCKTYAELQELAELYK